MAHDQEVMGSNPGTVVRDASYYIYTKITKIKAAEWSTQKKNILDEGIKNWIKKLIFIFCCQTFTYSHKGKKSIFYISWNDNTQMINCYWKCGYISWIKQSLQIHLCALLLCISNLN